MTVLSTTRKALASAAWIATSTVGGIIVGWLLSALIIICTKADFIGEGLGIIFVCLLFGAIGMALGIAKVERTSKAAPR
jgi:hypothetical protein